jgi:hypothetical protein
LDLLRGHIKAIKLLHLELLFLGALMKVLYQEITLVPLGAMVSFLVVELTLSRTMDLLIHMAEQTLMVRILPLVVLLLPTPTGAIWKNPPIREPKGLLHLHTVILDVTLPACRLQVYRHIFPVLLFIR